MDQSSFDSILAGVRQMREAYEPVIVEREARNKNESKESPKDSADSTKDSRKDSPSDSPRDSPGPRPEPKDPKPANASRRQRTNVHSYTAVQVANSQKGNPLLESPSMRLTPWAYNAQILLDYYINATVQVLFLSLKYHKLRPEYVWRRIEKLKGNSLISRDENDQTLRVLLVVVDIESPQEQIRNLSSICIKHDLSMIVAWLFEEAGNYIAYFKQNEMSRHKVNSSIQGIKKSDYALTIVNTLTTVRAVNKTDVANLLANCKTFKNVVVRATDDSLGDISGMGRRKLDNLKRVFSEPFIYNKPLGGSSAEGS